MVDHVSDAFLDPTTPIGPMCGAAQAGDLQGMEKGARFFTEHAQQLEKAALLACSFSNYVEGIRMVKVAAKHVHILRPQVRTWLEIYHPDN